MPTLSPLPLPHSILESLDSREVWHGLSEAHRYLGELKGLCESLPNPDILVDTLTIQEAKDSSEIENIIATLIACVFKAL
jgi:Fic family protein